MVGTRLLRPSPTARAGEAATGLGAFARTARAAYLLGVDAAAASCSIYQRCCNVILVETHTVTLKRYSLTAVKLLG